MKIALSGRVLKGTIASSRQASRRSATIWPVPQGDVMDTIRLIRNMVMVASLTLIVGVVIGPAQAADKHLKAVVTTAAATPQSGLGITASGAVEDNLKTCMGRIPKDASAGQRMMAEQGCGRDQETRKSFDAAPGR
jgi:hypothetical protein